MAIWGCRAGNLLPCSAMCPTVILPTVRSTRSSSRLSNRASRRFPDSVNAACTPGAFVASARRS